jgi:hypothetical protein
MDPCFAARAGRGARGIVDLRKDDYNDEKRGFNRLLVIPRSISLKSDFERVGKKKLSVAFFIVIKSLYYMSWGPGSWGAGFLKGYCPLAFVAECLFLMTISFRNHRKSDVKDIVPLVN